MSLNFPVSNDIPLQALSPSPQSIPKPEQCEKADPLAPLRSSSVNSNVTLVVSFLDSALLNSSSAITTLSNSIPKTTQSETNDTEESQATAILDKIINAAIRLGNNFPKLLPAEPDIEQQQRRLGEVQNPTSIGAVQRRQYSPAKAQELMMGQQELSRVSQTSIVLNNNRKVEDMAELSYFYQGYPNAKKFFTTPCTLKLQSNMNGAQQYALVLQALIGAKSRERTSWDLFAGPYLILLHQRLRKQNFQRFAGNQSRLPLESQFNDSEDSQDWLSILVEVSRTTYMPCLGESYEVSVPPQRNIEDYSWRALTFGHCIERCRRRNLPQISNSGAANIQEDVANILDAIGLTNIISVPMIRRAKSKIGNVTAQELSQMYIRDLLCEARQEPGASPRNNRNTFPRIRTDSEIFTPHDLDLSSLIEIGKLTLIWTSYLDQHLMLDTDSKSSPKLTIYWCAYTLNMVPIYALYDCDCEFHPSLSDTCKELSLTYKFLFHFPEDSTGTRAIRRIYGRQDAPTWLREFHEVFGDISRGKNVSGQISGWMEKCYVLWFTALGAVTWFLRLLKVPDFLPYRQNQWIGYKRISQCIDLSHLQDHCDPGWQLSARKSRLDNTALMRFTDFEMYGARIRDLKRYMEQPKARGLRDLWRDQRDTIAWYTFWAVILFGALTVLLTFVSLGIASAQTYAAFRQLNQPTSPS